MTGKRTKSFYAFRYWVKLQGALLFLLRIRLQVLLLLLHSAIREAIVIE